MFFDTVQIRRHRGFGKITNPTWAITFQSDGVDRVRGACIPFAVGWYHYPKYIGEKRAFEKLKATIAKAIKKEQRQVAKDLKDLEALKFEDSLSRGRKASRKFATA